MAKMYPELSSAELAKLDSRAERRVYEACRDQLAEHILVRHSVGLVAAAISSAPRDREVDFLLFDPAKGIIAIEVKGGGISVDSRGKWHSESKNRRVHVIKNPFRQASECKHEVLAQLKRLSGWPTDRHSPFPIGHAVLLADMEPVQLQSMIGPESPAEILGGRRDIDRLPEWLDGVLTYWRGRERGLVPLGQARFELAADWFCRRFQARPLMSIILEDEERQRIELTERQSQIFGILGHRRRALIAGAAGTGKTVLAVKRAGELACSGLRTLLLCFNSALADHLKFELERANSTVEAMNFHELCRWRVNVASHELGKDLIAEARQRFRSGSEAEVLLPFALQKSTELLDFRYDAILVDEAQDFRKDYWLVLQNLLRDRERSYFYVFYDPNQAIYANADNIPIQEEPFYLPENCRNTAYIHDAAYRYYEGEEIKRPAICGEPIEILTHDSFEAQATKVQHLVSRLIRDQKLDPSAITVLVACSSEKYRYYEELERRPLGRGVMWSCEAHRRPNAVLMDTVARFKGLEAGIVVLWGIEALDSQVSRELLYVGLSRAKSRLYLVGTSAACKEVLGADDASAGLSLR